MQRALLWDHDGVLVDTERLYFQATREVLATVGVELDLDGYRELFLVQGGGAWHLAKGPVDPAALRQRRNERYTQLLLSEDTLIPGVLPMLEALAPHYRMAIVTSSRRDHFDAIHRSGVLPRFFELVLAREDYHSSKPDPEPYLSALQRMDLAPAQCLVIEDSQRGLQAARAAGLRCWVIPSAMTRDSDFTGAERSFESLASLQSALLAR